MNEDDENVNFNPQGPTAAVIKSDFVVLIYTFDKKASGSSAALWTSSWRVSRIGRSTVCGPSPSDGASSEHD